MDKELFSLAVEGVRRKRRTSGLVLLVLLVSFGFALMSLSLLGSIQATNASYRQDLYGSWYYALPNGQPQDAEFLSRWAGAKRWGRMQCYGTTRGGVSIGTIDEGLRELGGLELVSGAWPSALREVAIEEDVLTRMGLEAVPGQEIDLDIVIRCGDDTLIIQRSYTLTGVIRPYRALDVERKRRLAPGRGGGEPGGGPGRAGADRLPHRVPRHDSRPAGLLLFYPAPV